MSSGPWSRQIRRRTLPSGADEGRLVRLALVVPLVLMLLSVAGLTLCCGALLQEAAAGRPAEVADFVVYLAAGAFLLAGAAVVAVQSMRVAARVAGPEHRLRLALRRIRAGDLGFRVHLRRGDLLGGLAVECNQLLDWLNQNPPGAVRRGSDLVDVDGVGEDHAAEEEVAP